jgi:hypothetical protein
VSSFNVALVDAVVDVWAGNEPPADRPSPDDGDALAEAGAGDPAARGVDEAHAARAASARTHTSQTALEVPGDLVERIEKSLA